jgi:alpha-amylase/alpha-mannosidase (GH57 family)
MPEQPLYVALVWHMHQPYYRDMLTGQISMPWVRLHAAKDYLHMGQVLAAHPAMHLTINMVPSLTEQMLDWAAGTQTDVLAQLAEQDDWTLDEKRRILNLAFSVNWDNIVRRYARYAELLDRRPAALADPTTFSNADYRDLLAWFNLAWIDPNWLESDDVLRALVAKGRGFTRADLAVVHGKQRDIAAGVLPLYRRLAAGGQLEITASPYYHPILPLLIDTDAAQRPSPGLPLPNPPFTAQPDAAMQLQMAVEAHTAHFGAPPAGLWPSEGAVSAEALPLVAAAGFNWLATDEMILGRSLGRPFTRDGSNMITNPRALYQPYCLLTDAEIGPRIIFRDHELSDRIGFLYQHLPGQQAAEDMIYRLLEIRRRLDDPQKPYLVSIILDGENCWENYEHNGDVFLNAFYGLLSERPELKPVTVREYLAAHRPAGTLAKLVTGSWIAGDLTTWIGDPPHNRAWEALARTRAHLAQAAARATPPVAPAALATAWQALYAAEGSDWFWWYSHRNRSDQDALFDELFRHDLAAVYAALGEETPGWLQRPIREALARPAGRDAAGYISPALDAAPYPDEEWTLAATVQPTLASTGAMQRADILIERLFVGHDPHSLYLRLDLRGQLDNYDVAMYLGLDGDQPVNQRPRAHFPDPATAPVYLALHWEILRQPGQPAPFLSRAAGQEQWQSIGPLAAGVGEKTLEVAVPLTALGLTLGQPIRLLATLAQHGVIVAQLPERAMQTIELKVFAPAAPSTNTDSS